MDRGIGLGPTDGHFAAAYRPSMIVDTARSDCMQTLLAVWPMSIVYDHWICNAKCQQILHLPAASQ